MSPLISSPAYIPKKLSGKATQLPCQAQKLVEINLLHLSLFLDLSRCKECRQVARAVVRSPGSLDNVYHRPVWKAAWPPMASRSARSGTPLQPAAQRRARSFPAAAARRSRSHRHRSPRSRAAVPARTVNRRSKIDPLNLFLLDCLLFAEAGGGDGDCGDDWPNTARSFGQGKVDPGDRPRPEAISQHGAAGALSRHRARRPSQPAADCPG